MEQVKSEQPEFIRQSLPGLTVTQRQAWIEEKCTEARAEGMTWPRATWDEARQIILLECWRERPADQGAPRWQS